MENFEEAACRWLNAGKTLVHESSFGSASHAFGLAAECAIKHAMIRYCRGTQNLPRRHLPELIDDAKRLFGGRANAGLFQLVNSADYMQNWVIENRYWADNIFNDASCVRFQDHARRTLAAAGLGI